ncbi:MAG: GntR family transcriptional regulator [Planctomycetes bacterium]|nr:GntR family transcriptional regulator [Planctomycetota bacterium]
MASSGSGGRKRGRPVQAGTAFRRIADALRQRIVKGVWKPGEILPSQRTLARDLQTTVDTVRAATRLLHQEGWIARSPKRRLAVARPGGNQEPLDPRRAVLQLVPMPLHLKLKGSDAAELQRGIEDGAGRMECALIVVSSYALRTKLPSGWMDMPQSGILVTGLVSDGVLRECQKLAVPVVLADYPSAPRGLRCVGVDNFEAARACTERLIGMGHRRIAFLRRISFTRRGIDPDSRERQAGYEAALKAAGLHARKKDLHTAFHTETPDSPNIRSVAGPRAGYTAALVSDARTAELVIRAARKAGRRVPGAFSVACFQGLSAKPGISGMAFDFRIVGERALRAVFEPAGAPPVRVPAAWVDAGTAGPAPT